MIEKKEGYILSIEECIEKGGHKYDSSLFTLNTNRYARACLYCGHSQKGYVPSVIWEDEDES